MEAHYAERPISLLAAQQANLNRDEKKRRQPFDMDDFYLYQPNELRNAPAERYGAAAFWLVQNGMYPSWALFCFPELNKNRGKNVPTLIAFLHPSAMLLAPTMREDGVVGLLIAEECVSNSEVTMRSPCGQEIQVKIPAVTDEVAAQEDIILQLCG
jgi:hypothetical protein